MSALLYIYPELKAFSSERLQAFAYLLHVQARLKHFFKDYI